MSLMSNVHGPYGHLQLLFIVCQRTAMHPVLLSIGRAVGLPLVHSVWWGRVTEFMVSSLYDPVSIGRAVGLPLVLRCNNV
jgi:hypothetical protein